MSTAPIYWKSTLAEVEETLKLVKKGTVTKPCDSTGGRPIYQVEYGKSNLPKRTANCSSALGGKDIKAFADKTGADYNPTIFLCGCIHGGEWEGTVALLNLIKMIETGTDYAGNSNEELMALCEKVHLIIVPMVNPDGRSHIPFNSFVGRSFYDLRYYNQGTWKDGSLAGWPECKLTHPIKDAVDYLGGYFNDDGVNMMHEDFLGGKLSTGTQLVLDICRLEAPDFSVLYHGGSNTTSCMLYTSYASYKSKVESFEVMTAIKERCDKEGLRFVVKPVTEPEKNDNPPSFNLTSAMHHCCSEAVVTFESNQGLIEHHDPVYDYDEIYNVHIVSFLEILRYELKKFGKI